jgi:acetyl-CoA carboxylase biotin carboxyl carrier protein
LDQEVKINSEAVRSLAELLRETDLTEIEYQVDSLRIKVSRTIQQTVLPINTQCQQQPTTSAILTNFNQHSSSVASKSSSAEAMPENLENHPGVIEAQMVGTVYLSPGPNANPFVSVGDRVSQGQTLFIIEAMKVMNMIKAPRSGVVRHIFVKDAQPVEYGDPIIIID